MSTSESFDAWSAGDSYEHYMGRWSRKIATEFLSWMAPAQGLNWLEIGCGSGALTSAILTQCAPGSIVATDASPDFVAHARSKIVDERVRFQVADAQSLPTESQSSNCVVSALVLNFVPDKIRALSEMRRVLRPGGHLAFYVWDYPGGGMGFINEFWKAAAEIDREAVALNESTRFPFCTADGLADLCAAAGIADTAVAPIEVETRFPDFESFWHPFTLGAGPAPGYCKGLSNDKRAALKERLFEILGRDGQISLPARAWAAKARMLD